MGRCPFGFTGDEEDEDNVSEELQAEGQDGTGSDNQRAKKAHETTDKPSKKHKKEKIKVPGSADPNTDPVSWFYKNQIKSEAEFQAKKEALRAEAKKRLDFIMDKKNQRLMWPSDSEFDDMSFSSGEMSELDSDVHSLASVRTCAYSWIAKNRYHMPAEVTLRLSAAICLVLSLVALYKSYQGVSTVRPLLAVVRHGDWLTYALLISLVVGGAASMFLLSANWRSRKLLLAAELSAMVTYGVTVALTTLMWNVNIEVDPRMQSALCSKWGGEHKRKPYKAADNPMCGALPKLQASVTQASQDIRYWMAGVALCCTVLCCVGLWYMLELCFVEKKGIKHVRRHRRKRFTIPWDKIKIVGKPLACGQGGGQPAGFRPAGHGKNKNI